MNAKLLTAAAAAATAVVMLQPAHAQSAADCNSMLTVAVGQDLMSEGFDTDKLCELTVAELATIKGLLEEDGMTASTKGRIEVILDRK